MSVLIIYQKLHGVVRPLSLKTDVIKKRNRTQPPAKEPTRKGSLASSKASARKGSGTSPIVASGSSIANGHGHGHGHGNGANSNPNASASTGGKKARRASDGPDRSDLGSRGLSMSLGR